MCAFSALTLPFKSRRKDRTDRILEVETNGEQRCTVEAGGVGWGGGEFGMVRNRDSEHLIQW